DGRGQSSSLPIPLSNTGKRGKTWASRPHSVPDVSTLRLTEWTSCGGCAAKWGASPLDGLVKTLADGAAPGLLVGLAPFDDAAVYRLDDDYALVSTTDFFPPLVDDPDDFGAIAAANARSDVFTLSKPIGTGILLAGGGEDDKATAIARMRVLNQAAADVLAALPEPPHAVTDVTGFGLLGHAWEMAERSGVRIELEADGLPL